MKENKIFFSHWQSTSCDYFQLQSPSCLLRKSSCITPVSTANYVTPNLLYDWKKKIPVVYSILLSCSSCLIMKRSGQTCTNHFVVEYLDWFNNQIIVTRGAINIGSEDSKYITWIFASVFMSFLKNILRDIDRILWTSYTIFEENDSDEWKLAWCSSLSLASKHHTGSNSGKEGYVLAQIHGGGGGQQQRSGHGGEGLLMLFMGLEADPGQEEWLSYKPQCLSLSEVASSSSSPPLEVSSKGSNISKNSTGAWEACIQTWAFGKLMPLSWLCSSRTRLSAVPVPAQWLLPLVSVTPPHVFLLQPRTSILCLIHLPPALPLSL